MLWWSFQTGDKLRMSQSSPGVRLAALKYKVVRTLGHGAGSTISLITDTEIGAPYALKVIERQSPDDEIYINQAIHEFEVTRPLNQVNLLKIHDVRVKRRWFRNEGVELLMEYVDGRTLDDVATRAIDQLVLIFIQATAGLAHMHKRGIYHGDLKPSNLMLSRFGQVKVIDFGTAWVKGQPKNRVQGTPQYMAPEQAQDRVVDDRTDLYNLGATMYRMFTGEYANLGVPELDGALAARRRPAALALRPDLPGTLNETIMRCLDPNPDRRPSSCIEVRDQLVAVARHRGLRPEDLKGSEEGAEDD